jgi:hypothetical protein
MKTLSSKATVTASDKQRNAAGQTCWPGYRRHPVIKEGPGSCVPATYRRVATAGNATGAGAELPAKVVVANLVTSAPKSVAEYLKAASGNLKAHLGWMFGAVKLDERTGDLIVLLDTRDPVKAQQCFRRVKTALDPLGLKSSQIKLETIKSDMDGGDFYDCRVRYETAPKEAFASTQVRAASVATVYSVVVDWTEKGEWLIGSGCVALTKRFAKFGVSAHVLPGLEGYNDSSDKPSPLVMIVGASSAQIKKVLDQITPGNSKSYYDSIVKIPV